MKASLKQQIMVVDEIRAAESRIHATKILRNWLEKCGYEKPWNCTHYTVVRSTGRCSSCGIMVQ